MQRIRKNDSALRHFEWVISNKTAYFHHPFSTFTGENSRGNSRATTSYKNSTSHSAVLSSDFMSGWFKFPKRLVPRNLGSVKIRGQSKNLDSLATEVWQSEEIRRVSSRNRRRCCETLAALFILAASGFTGIGLRR